MELTWLEAFVAVADEGSFVRAAERVHLGQPAVSQHVRRLETSLGVALFGRTSRRVDLTEAGRSLLPAARKVLADVARLQLRAGDLTSGTRLRLGTSTGLGARLGALVAELAAHSPGTEVELLRFRFTERLDAVRAGRLDAAFAQALRGARGLEVVEAWREPLVAALPASHRLAEQDSVELADLREVPVRLAPRRSNPPFHDAMTRLLDADGPVERGPRFTTLQDVLTDLGSGRTAWTPLYGDVPATRGLRVLPVAGQEVVTGMAVLPGPPGPLVRLLLDAVATVSRSPAYS